MGAADQLLIIGYGNMSSAMLAGWLASGMQPERFAVLNRSPKQVPPGVVQYGTIAEAEQAGAHSAIMLGFKPYQLNEVAADFQALAKGKAVHSLLAGITLDQLHSAFPDASTHLRVMPNLAARVGKSPVLLSESGLLGSQREAITQFYDVLGNAVWLDDEGKYDLATALAGSGPGFVYRFIDALAAAGQELGLEAEQAASLALSMVEGASELASTSQFSPADLADRVASPGGMTREGLNVLDEENALVNLLTRTLKAARDRGAELSKGSN